MTTKAAAPSREELARIIHAGAFDKEAGSEAQRHEALTKVDAILRRLSAPAGNDGAVRERAAELLERRADGYSGMRYLIWSNEHRGWWKPNRHGYTTRTDKAGQFSFEEAKEICDNANRYDQPLSKQPKPLTYANEIMVEAPSRDQIKLDLEYPDR